MKIFVSVILSDLSNFRVIIHHSWFSFLNFDKIYFISCFWMVRIDNNFHEKPKYRIMKPIVTRLVARILRIGEFAQENCRGNSGVT